MVFTRKPCLWKVLQFLVFFAMKGVWFCTCTRIPASFSDQGTNSEDCTKVEQVDTGFVSSKFPTVIILSFFSLYVFIFWCYSSYFILLRRCCSLWLLPTWEMKLLDFASIMTEKMVTVRFRDTSVRSSPVTYRKNFGQYFDPGGIYSRIVML